MAYGSINAPGPKNWGFLPTGPTQQVALGATSVTVTLSQFVTTAPYAPQCLFQCSGASAVNSFAFVAFGSNTITVSNTVGVPLVASQLMSQHGASGAVNFQVLTTGKTPEQYAVIGSAGTLTVWVTPGIGRG